MRLLHDVVRKKRAVLPKTRNITVWNIPPKFMPLYYTNATLEEIPVTVPEPPEQRRIADCLSSVDATIAAQVREYEALKTHKIGLMQGLFPSINEADA